MPADDPLNPTDDPFAEPEPLDELAGMLAPVEETTIPATAPETSAESDDLAAEEQDVRGVPRPATPPMTPMGPATPIEGGEASEDSFGRLAFSGRLDDDYRQKLAQKDSSDSLQWLLENGGGDDLIAQEAAREQTGIAQGGPLRFAILAAKDVGSGLTTGAANITIGGPLLGLQSTLDAAKETADWLNANVGKLPFGVQLYDKKTGAFAPRALVGEEARQIEDLPPTVPNIGGTMDAPESVTGRVLQGFTQFLTGFLLARRVTGLKGATSTAGRGAQTVTNAALADFAAFEGHEANLANLVQEIPALQNPVTEYLMADEETPALVGRLKRVVVDTPLNVGFEGLLAGLRAIREARRARALAGADSYAEAADKLARGGADIGQGPPPAEVGAKVEEMLGRADAPLVSLAERQIKPVETGVPDEMAARGLTSPQPGPLARDITINWARIDALGDVKQVIGQMADAFAPEIDAARRGVRSNAETLAAAGDENAWKLLLGERKGNLPRAEEQLALRQLWAASGQKLMDVAKAAVQGDEASLFAFRRMLAVHNTVQQEVIGIRTETARALQQWRIPAGGSQEQLNQLRFALEAAGGGEKVTRALAERIAVLADMAKKGVPGAQGALDYAARKGTLAKTADAVREVWINAILSGPKTHIVNMMSNSSVVAQSIAERAAAGLLGDIIDPVDGVRVGEALAMWQGIKESFKDALIYAGRSFKSGESGFGRGKIEGPRVRAISSEALSSQDSMEGKALDMLGSAVSVPGRLLVAEDEFFKTINYRAEVWAQAFRSASEEVERGLIPKTGLKARMAEIVTEPPENIRLKAADMAAYNTFTNEPGPAMRALVRMRNDVPGLYFVLPFINTPGNIIKYGFERTPLAPLMSKVRADLAAGGARRDLALARMGLGSMVMLTAFDLALDGNLTGSGPVGEKHAGQRQALARLGWQRYSMRVRTGGTEAAPTYRYFGYNRLDPLGSLLGVAADLAEHLRATDGRVDPQFEEVFSAAVLGAMQNMTDKTYLYGFANFIDAMRNPDRRAESYFNRFVSSFVPTGVAEVARFVDPVLRYTTDLASALKARTPGLSKDLPPKLNFWGEEIKYQSGLGSGYDLISPIYSRSSEKATPIDKEFVGLNYFPKHPADIKIKRSDGISDEQDSVPLRNEPQAQNRWIELTAGTRASQLVSDNENEEWMFARNRRSYINKLTEYEDKTLKEVLNDLVTGNSDAALDYQAAEPEEKQGMIKDIIGVYRGTAKEQVIREFPILQELRDGKPRRSELAPQAPY